MHLEESTSNWMRVKKFLAHTTLEIGQRLGWNELHLYSADQDLRIPFSNFLHDGNIARTKTDLCYSKIFHSDGWYRNDELGSHFVSFGNGASFNPHGYPSIACTLYCVVGEARMIVVPNDGKRKGRKKRRLLEPSDLLVQSRYHGGILLFGLHDGTLAVADEHPFFESTHAFLKERLTRFSRTMDYTLPGVIIPCADNAAITICERQYNRQFVHLLAQHLVMQIISMTEGSAMRQESVIQLLTPTQ